MTKVRHLHTDDIEALLDVVRDTYLDKNGIGKNDDNFDSDSTRVSLRRMYLDPSFNMLVYDEEDTILGFMIVKMATSPVNDKDQYAVDIGWGAEKDVPRMKQGRILIELFREMKSLLKMSGIKRFILSTPLDNSLQYYVERSGGKRVEVKYMMEL